MIGCNAEIANIDNGIQLKVLTVIGVTAESANSERVALLKVQTVIGLYC